jgi:methylmalonyl-CoA mutase
MSDESYNPAGQNPQEADSLFREFPVSSYEEWRNAAEKALKGASFAKKLITKTYEGIDLQPIYQQNDIENLPHTDFLPGFTPYVRGTDLLGYTSRPWDVCQEIAYSTPEAFNEALRFDLKRGQNAVNLVLDRATRQGLDADQAKAEAVGQGGISMGSLEDLQQALEGIDLEKTPIYIQADTMALPMVAFLVALARQQGKKTEKIKGCIGLDPLGVLAREGTLDQPLESAYEVMGKLTAWAIKNSPHLQTIIVQGHPYHDGGGSIVQELGFALATAVEYLRQMQNRGLAISAVSPRLRFAFSIGSNFFMEIARLRAARLLWAKIVKAFGGDEQAQKMALHGRTSNWNKTVYDPYVNMLRTTTEAFAGIVGGCNSLHVAPFDEIIRSPDEFSRRIARNTHTILRQECHIARTVDPAGGSWYVESLTDAVARRSWALFQEVERRGGMGKALEAGFPQAQIAEVAAQRASHIARRQDVFVGTNRYANLQEKPLEVAAVDTQKRQRERAAHLEQYRNRADANRRKSALEKLGATGDYRVEAAIEAAGSGATLGDMVQALQLREPAKTTIKPVCIHRGAQPFENLRRAAEDYSAQTGSRPTVFLANMGPVSQHKARADFTAGFMAVAGFEILSNRGFANPEQAAQAALESGAAIVAICSTDATYPELVAPLTEHLKQAKPEIIVLLAGYPADQVEAHKAAGIDDFIYLGANCYEILSRLQKKLGVAP